MTTKDDGASVIAVDERIETVRQAIEVTPDASQLVVPMTSGIHLIALQ
jgi:hypothetical protein